MEDILVISIKETIGIIESQEARKIPEDLINGDWKQNTNFHPNIIPA